MLNLLALLLWPGSGTGTTIVRLGITHDLSPVPAVSSLAPVVAVASLAPTPAVQSLSPTPSVTQVT